MQFITDYYLCLPVVDPRSDCESSSGLPELFPAEAGGLRGSLSAHIWRIFWYVSLEGDTSFPLNTSGSFSQTPGKFWSTGLNNSMIWFQQDMKMYIIET